ncbi:phage tail protein [Salmonella enterica subsp. enterica serovar Muenchen]|uniref:Phage tail protein n=1 Tax=Salmonella enterica TaxID=28901 RepID=A0A764Z358_SALER|nr:phage tail protein [Salmonella enterica]EBW7254759.1 phage tail protein [Salmonella enterica subsp. enterica serovar Gatow]EBZ0384839.1 phage tail protein [Salmonella enterica subsp. enterica serovar Oranienburg]ECD5832870.1 phage tail protein [Salmonella enterica subsp. enterica serovar Newport]HCA3587927.1 phage tail protein [Salmonella enterica subsp. enterica serovar Java]HCM6305250.1 phage tail protein [Salmonella enterica subsp. enterica serovar 6,14:y:1,7]
MSLKGLENAVQNLSSIDRQMIPRASAMTINRLAQKAISFATHKVAKETVAGDNHRQGIPFRLVKQRVRLWKASPRFDVGKQYARIRINRGNLPAIKLGTAQVRLTRRKGQLLRGGSVLKIGPYLFRDAFIQQLANGRWHVMKRIEGKKRYPIDVVKVPLAAALTQNFEEAKNRIIAEEFPKELASSLKQQLRLYLTRRL